MKGGISLKEKVSNEVKVLSKINRKKLSKYHYTNSLMEEAFNEGMLSTAEVGNIQAKLLECLSDVIMQKTKGESTSLPVDETTALMASLVYTLDIYLEQFDNPDDAVKLLKEEAIDQLIHKGTQMISDQYDEIKEMYLYLVKNKLEVPLDCYHSTIDVAVPTFLKSYNIVFAAQVTATTIDYPLAKDDWDVCGVKYMYTYMKRIILETHFCKMFGDQKVINLLECFGKAIKMDYKLELLNIFELVLNNALFLQLAGKDPLNLIFEEEDRKVFVKSMKQWNQKEISLYLKEGADKLIQTLKITDEETVTYIYDYLPTLIKRTKNVLQNNSVDSIILANAKEEQKQKSSIFQSAESMSSRKFQKLTDKISDIYDAEEKAEYIITHIQSIHDLVDIFNSDYLYGDEYDALYSKFGDFELALLSKIVYYEEMRDNKDSLRKLIKSMDWFDYEWKEFFTSFMLKLSEERIKNVEKLVEAIDYTQLHFD